MFGTIHSGSKLIQPAHWLGHAAFCLCIGGQDSSRRARIVFAWSDRHIV
ncbi:MAG: hypothetical protein L0Y55_06975 [Anaerolineales bacterium]|nr:hypothetical protein [Anaerolineales bacterium]